MLVLSPYLEVDLRDNVDDEIMTNEKLACQTREAHATCTHVRL